MKPSRALYVAFGGFAAAYHHAPHPAPFFLAMISIAAAIVFDWNDM